MAEPDVDTASRTSLRPGSPIAEPARGGHPQPELFSLPGVEQLRRQIAGEVPDSPLSRLTGLRLVSVGDGTASFRMPLTGWLASGGQAVPLGPLAIPADAAMACAVMTQLPAWTPFTTSELALRVLHAPRPEGLIHAEGRVIDPGPPVALAQATLRDEAGTLIAYGTSLCVTLPAVSPDAEAAALQHPGTAETPDPWQREPVGPEPLQTFTGLALAGAHGGTATLTLPASSWFCAPPAGRVQGGLIALLADAAISSAVTTELAPKTRFAAVELKLNLLRPLVSDGRRARATARTVHAGRRMGVATAELVNADGRAIAIASGSGLLEPAS